MCACVTAREQLRRSRHSRTFLVESGTGELWSELQTGKAVCVSMCVCVCVCVYLRQKDPTCRRDILMTLTFNSSRLTMNSRQVYSTTKLEKGGPDIMRRKS